MKPKMSAAQFEARLKARLFMTNPTYACSDARWHQQDCEETGPSLRKRWMSHMRKTVNSLQLRQ